MQWVLLRGLTREAGHWGAFATVLRQALPGATLHLPDLAGNGARHAERSPASVHAMVADLQAWLADRNVSGPVHVLALSLGAMVALEWARTAPQDIASAVLVNTSLRRFSPVHHRLRPAHWPRLLALPLWARSAHRADVIERRIWQMTSSQTPDEAVIRHWVALRQHHPVSATNALRQLWAAARYRAPATPPPVPLLLLSSAGDGLVHPACSQAIARAWQLPLHTHPSAGHDLPLDDARWLASQLRTWALQTAPAEPLGPGPAVAFPSV